MQRRADLSIINEPHVLPGFPMARDIVEHTGYGKGMCFRLLHTLHHCGFVEKIDERHTPLVASVGYFPER